MKIAVSSCLLGVPCRFDGEARKSDTVVELCEKCEVVRVCPETAGGLRRPRDPSEISGPPFDPRVVSSGGEDVTDAFLLGARRSLDKARDAGCKLAIFKSKSPSCACGQVFDGTFSGTLKPGYGIATRMFREAGIRVLTEREVEGLLAGSSYDACLPIIAETSAECPILKTSRLVLKPITREDEDAVFDYCRVPEVGFAAGWPPYKTIEDTRAFIDEIASAPHVFGIFEARPGGSSVGPCIGSVGLVPDPRRHNPDCLMLGYALSKNAWGKGFMPEAARAVIQYGFDQLNLPLLTSNCYAFNSRSARVLEKLGFACEGVMRGVETTSDGFVQDLRLFSLTREEFENSKAV